MEKTAGLTAFFTGDFAGTHFPGGASLYIYCILRRSQKTTRIKATKILRLMVIKEIFAGAVEELSVRGAASIGPTSF